MRSARRSARYSLACAALLLAMASCASVPEAARGGDGYLDMLPSGQTAYVWIDVARTRDVILAVAERQGFRARDIAPVLQRASGVYATLDLASSDRPTFTAVATGRFPPGAVRASLCLRPEWRRVREGDLWYEDRLKGLQVAAIENGELYLSNGRIRDLLVSARAPRPAPLSREIASLAAESDLLLYFPAVPPGLGLGSGPAAPPVQRLWVAASRAAETETEPAAGLETLLSVDLGFVLAGEREARLFRPVLRLLLVGLARQGLLPGGTGSLRGVTDELEGAVLRLHGLKLTLEQAITASQALLDAGMEDAGGGE